MARNNYRGGTTTRRAPKDLGRRVKKKPCAMCREGVEWVDYKDLPVLRKYMSDRGKIRSRRVTGNCAQHQRDIAQAIKLARELVLLPYTQRTVTEKPSGRGRDRGDRGDRPMGSRGERPGGDRSERPPRAAEGAEAPAEGAVAESVEEVFVAAEPVEETGGSVEEATAAEGED
jgi:small subunit ribosomal protein S18